MRSWKQVRCVGVVALVVRVTTGCESISTKTDYDKAFNFGGYHTFSWISTSPLVSKVAGSQSAGRGPHRERGDVLC